MKDTIIIGAGPSGSQLALGLARRGYQVLVAERKAAPGDDACCTGIVSRECLESFGIDRSLIIRSASSARLVSPSGKWLRLWRDSEVAYVLDRPALDRALAKRAEDAGAEFLFGTQVIDLHVAPGGVRARTKDSTIEARTAVLATGFGSQLPARLGLGRIADHVTGGQARVEVKDAGEVELYFDQNLAPGGFSWLVPTEDGYGLAGVISRHQPELCLRALLSRLREQGKIAPEDVEMSYAAIPLRPLARTSAGRILVVGEAAGQVKPTSGGGIYYGLLCADIAAETLHQALTANDFSQGRLSSYDKRWRAKLARELNSGYRLRRMAERLTNDQIESVFNVMKSSNVPGFVAGLEELNFDRHSSLILKLLGHLIANAPLHPLRAMLAKSRVKGDRPG